MKKKPGRRNVPWLLIVIAVCLSLAAGYFIGTRKSAEPPQPRPLDRQEASRQAGPTTEPGGTQEKIQFGKVEMPIKMQKEGDECRELLQDLNDFFEYLDKKAYVQQIEPGIKTREWLNRIITKLSANPPAPAGEGLDPAVIAENVFYFFRNLDHKELRLLRDIMVNEESTIEANMELVFQWLSLGNRCPDAGGRRPSPEVLYSYAGFFLNTIGGRAYLFRTSPGIRSLVTYYCLLIVHDADKKGKNIYGINIAPHLKRLSAEMNHQGAFLFQKDYRKRIDDLQGFYRGR